MKGKFLYILFLLLLSLSFVDCAKRGFPSGGPRDTIPPVVTRTVPENYGTDFTGKEIQIFFDEYIKLKNINQQLLISPPLENRATITPLTTSRNIEIVFNEELRENTTYSMNFGKSITDNNEENPLDFYKFVFSTGSYIDSLKLKGTVRDAQLIQPEESITVMLYEASESFNDSLVYTQKPFYVTNTRGTSGAFEFENLKSGRYFLVALTDQNNNYNFDPRAEKIGFIDTFVDVPADTSYTVTIFNEILPYKLSRPVQKNNNHILFGYEGQVDSLEVEMLSEKSAGFERIITKETRKDSLNYWFQPEIQKDSLVFRLTANLKVDTLTVRMSEKPRDSLQVRVLKSGVLAFDENVELTANLPIVKVDEEKISIMDKDSAAVDFTAKLDTLYNILTFQFKKEERQVYNIKMLPEAVTDFFGNKNDTLNYNASTRTYGDYGFLSLTVENIESYPVIVQLVTDKGEVKKETISDNESTFTFEYITPGKYYARLVYDENANGRWDTGSFLDRRQPEEIIYYPKLLDIRPNWTLSETFILE